MQKNYTVRKRQVAARQFPTNPNAELSEPNIYEYPTPQSYTAQITPNPASEPQFQAIHLFTIYALFTRPLHLILSFKFTPACSIVTLYQLQLPSHYPSRLSLVFPYITSPAFQNHIISLPLFHHPLFLHLQTISPHNFHSTRQLIFAPPLFF